MIGRPARFHVAQLRDVITIATEVATVDPIGQTIRNWQPTHPDVPAKFEPVAGAENVRGRTVEAGVTVVFTIRSVGRVSPADQVYHLGDKYGIAYAKPVDGYPRFTELHCKRVAE